MDTSDPTSGSVWLDIISATSSDYYDVPMSAGSRILTKCTFELCGFNGAYFAYRPSQPANLAFAVLFGVSTLVFLAQGIVRPKWIGFTVAMVLGCAVELAGYVARYVAHDDLYTEIPFLVQIICLTIAPAILAAGVYLCLSRIVTTFGQDNSRISARTYPIIFVTCDIVSLLLQAGGGGYASVKMHNREDPKVGNSIMIVGLSVQVSTLLVFILLTLDFAVHTIRRIRRMGARHALDQQHAELRKSWSFKCFLVALSVSTLCIFTRCVYRVAELSDGWEGHLMKKQNLFLGLEGAVILVVVYLLNSFHPGFCFKESLSINIPTRIDSGGRDTVGQGRTSSGAESSREELRAEELRRGWSGSVFSDMGQVA